MTRYDPDGAKGWWPPGAAPALPPVGTRCGSAGGTCRTLVFRDRPARATRRLRRRLGRAARPPASRVPRGRRRAGHVEGRLWGVMAVGSREAAAAGGHRGPAGRVHRAGRHRDRQRAGAHGLRGFAEEQAALRRVATLVARAAPPEEVFAAVAAEAGRLLGRRRAVTRYDPDGAARSSAPGAAPAPACPVGTRGASAGGTCHAGVPDRPAGADRRLRRASGAAADVARKVGVRSAVGVPVSVEGRLWGVIFVASGREPLPRGHRGAAGRFTELAATAIANAEAQAALAASRARIVAAADQTRRRIERDLHDGAQQRLVSLALQLRAAQAAAPPGAGELAQHWTGGHRAGRRAGGTARDRPRHAPGHPGRGRAGPALEALARRAAVPVGLDVQVEGRLPEPVEVAAYYVVAEALANAAKHAHASAAEVEVAAGEGMLRVASATTGAAARTSAAAPAWSGSRTG